jgi:hypothetical protein
LNYLRAQLRRGYWAGLREKRLCGISFDGNKELSLGPLTNKQLRTNVISPNQFNGWIRQFTEAIHAELGVRTINVAHALQNLHGGGLWDFNTGVLLGGAVPRPFLSPNAFLKPLHE